MIEQLQKRGNHTFMSPEEIDKWYNKIQEEHELYLKEYNVELPKRNSSSALWLVFLRKHKGKLVHKDTISAFVNSVNPQAGKDQQVRHLARKGWFVLNKGDKIPDEDELVKSGYHVLLTTEQPKPSFLHKAIQRAGRISAKNFTQLKIAYHLRCATCGSQEGKPHLLEQNQRTKLQQGHMNPHKELTLDNSIPQCQICNQVYQDNFVFNEKGRIVAVASARPVLKADLETKKTIRKALDDTKGT